MNERQSVRWNDGTYDSSRVCDTCQSTACKTPTHHDAYRELVSAKYSDWMDKNAPHGFTEEGTVKESVQANPNQLLEIDSTDPAILLEEADNAPRESLDRLRKAAYRVLTAKQKEVWDLCMRDGLSEQAAGLELGISNDSVHDRLTGAKAKFTNYLRDHANEA